MNDAKLGWYIWIDATCVSGPYDSRLEAYESLQKRGEWNGHFQDIPIHDFSIDYHEEP